MKTNTFCRILIQLISVTAVFSYNCDIFRCASTSGWVLAANQCVAYHKNESAKINYFEIDLSHCNSNQYCPNQMVKTEQGLGCYDKPTSSDRTDPTKGLDLDPCERDNDCKSNNCDKNKKCAGKTEDKECVANNECKIGMFCSQVSDTKKVCKSQKDIGEKCENDQDCLNNSGCLGEGTSKVCVKLYSLADNIKVFIPENRKFCESNYARDGVCVSHKLMSPDECLGLQEECNYQYITPTQSDPIKFTLPCECSPAHHDKKFCPIATNNELWKNMIPSYLAYYNGAALKKHTVLRNFFPKDVLIKQFEVEKYPAFKDADKCYREFMTNGNMIKAGLLMIVSLVLFMF